MSGSAIARSFAVHHRELKDTVCAAERVACPMSTGNWQLVHSPALRSLKAFAITDTELNVIAALAQIGLTSRPTNG